MSSTILKAFNAQRMTTRTLSTSFPGIAIREQSRASLARRSVNLKVPTQRGRGGVSFPSDRSHHSREPSALKYSAIRSMSTNASGEAFPHGHLEPIDLSVVSTEELQEFLREWRDNWYCYWDKSFGVPEDTTKNYVFKPALTQAKCGIVCTTEGWDEVSSEDVKGASEQLLLMQKRLDSDDVRCAGPA